MLHRNFTRVLVSLLGVAILLPAVSLPANAVSRKTTWTSAKVVQWIDGDTVVTTKGTIRVIGVDTPEVGVCGYEQATGLAQATAPPGSVVRLGNPRSVVNRDKYQRNLRYVVRKSTKVDISAMQIRNGAKARYDRLDGYQWHPRQTKYRNLDDATADYQCVEPAPAPVQPVVAPVPPVVAPVLPPAGPVDPAPQPVANPYQDRANLPVSGTNPDLDCGDIPTQYKPIRITGPDYHALDRDGDGLGCDV
jgi:endonuclease YncB( thermonuclease family)